MLIVCSNKWLVKQTLRFALVLPVFFSYEKKPSQHRRLRIMRRMKCKHWWWDGQRSLNFLSREIFLPTCDEKVWFESRKSTNALVAIVHLLSILCYCSCAAVKHERWFENDTCIRESRAELSRLIVFFLFAAIHFDVDKMFEMFRMQASKRSALWIQSLRYIESPRLRNIDSILEWIEMFNRNNSPNA